MNGRVAKDLRKQANQAARLAAETVAPAMGATLDYVRLIEQRVGGLEKRGLSLKSRLRWLLFGS